MAFGAFLHIVEFAQLGFSNYADSASYSAPLYNEETTVYQDPLAISSGNAQSDAFADTTQVVQLTALVDCHVQIGTDPEATTSSEPLAAKQKYYVCVPKGQAYKVSVIEA